MSETFLYSSMGDDPDFGELVEMFVSEMPERIQSLTDFYDTANWEELRRVAHQLNGAAGSYGFDQVTEPAAKLEGLAKGEPTKDQLQPAILALVGICERLRAGAPA